VSLLKLDTELVVLGAEDIDPEVGQPEAVPVLVDLPLLALLVLGDHHDVVEEEDAALVSIFLVLLLHVGDFGDPTEADESTSCRVEVGSLGAEDGLLDFGDLGDMVRALEELGGLDSVVDSSEHVTVHVGSVVNASEVSDEIFLLHLLLRLDTLVVEVRVEEDHRIGQDEDGIGSLEARYEHLVALDVALREHLHELLDHLSLAGDSNFGLKVTKGDVEVKTGEVHVMDKEVEHSQVERFLEAANKLSNLFLGKSFSS